MADIVVPLSDIEADLNTARPVVAGGTGATSAAAALANFGLTATAAELNTLDGITATVAELNVLDGIPGTLTATEIGHLDGVTSAIQTQLNAKQASGATLTSLSTLTLAAGDILYATAADTLVNLAKGTAGQVLQMNSGATAPEWGEAGLGVGQSWQDVFGSRSNGTSYQNTTGKPIMVAVEFTSSAGRTLQVSVNNSVWVTVAASYGGSGNAASVIIPDEHYYKVTGAAGVISWVELR